MSKRNVFTTANGGWRTAAPIKKKKNTVLKLIPRNGSENMMLSGWGKSSGELMLVCSRDLCIIKLNFRQNWTCGLS